MNNLQIVIKGEFFNNVLNGYGEVIYTEENKLLIGFWINGILGGIGIEKTIDYIYRGCFICNKKDGYGTQIWNDSSKYEGEWKDDQYDGYGIYCFPNGKKYSGEWEKSCKNGFGEFNLNNGRKFVGFYKKDQRNGFGIYYLGNNIFSVNFWENGRRHGLGKYIKGDDANYQLWENNKIIKDNMDEIEFMESFDEKISRYKNYFQWNNNDIKKFMNIQE